MKLVEDRLISDDDCRCFRWMKDNKQIATIFIDADGFVEFSSPETGDVGIYSIGDDDCSLQIDQMEIRIGEVRVG